MRIHAGVAVALLAATAGLARADSLDPLTVSARPAGSGSVTAPKPKRLSVDATLAGTEGQRPAVLRRMTAEIEGLVASEDRFRRCRLAQVEEPELVDVLAACKRAQVGSGRVLTVIGLSHDRSDHAPCDLDARVFNLGKRRIAVRLDRRIAEDCLVDPQVAIPATLRRVKVRGRAGERISFAVPADLRHPIPGLEVAITRVTLTTKLGFLSAIGCRARRLVRVTTSDEAGGKLQRELRIAC